jgi:hypothetical protein
MMEKVRPGIIVAGRDPVDPLAHARCVLVTLPSLICTEAAQRLYDLLYMINQETQCANPNDL